MKVEKERIVDAVAGFRFGSQRWTIKKVDVFELLLPLDECIVHSLCFVTLTVYHNQSKEADIFQKGVATCLSSTCCREVQKDR